MKATTLGTAFLQKYAATRAVPGASTHDLNNAAKYFEKHAGHLIPELKKAQSATKDETVPKDQRTRQLKTSLSNTHKFIERISSETSDDPTRPSKGELW